MDKFKIVRKMKKLNEKKENYTPNRIPLNKTRTHIKIRSRDIKNINLFIDDEPNQKMNITNFKTDNRILNTLPKSKLRQNRTLNNLLTLKKNKKVNKFNTNNFDKNHNNNSETYKKLLFLWEELGVNYIYQNIFNKITDSLNKEKKENYFIYESKKLNNIFNTINSIVNNINDREKIILQLQKNYYEENGNNIDDGNYNDKDTINKIISILLNIRKYSVEIVNNIIQLRKEIAYDVIMNKYDINKILVYPHDYLIKMNNDLDFLINTSLNKYFNFSKSDPFLIKLNIVNNNRNDNNLNKIYELPKIKEENILAIINNYDYLVFDELINQEVNLMTINPKNSHYYICNFTSKNKIIKSNNSKLNINKTYNSGINNNIIKANRGLSRKKLHRKINNNKIVIDSEISKMPKTKIINYHLFKYSNKNFIHDGKNSIREKNNKIFDEEKNEDNFLMNIKPNNIIIQNNPINEDDMKIFEKIIEQSIIEKNDIDKELILYNRIKKNNFSKKISKTKEKLEDLSSNKSIKVSNHKSIENTAKISKQNSNIINSFEYEITSLDKNNSNDNNYLKIYPYNCNNDEDLSSLYKEYLTCLDENMKQSFNLNNDIFYYSTIGIYPKIFLYKDKYFNIKGICTICFNQNINESLNINKKILIITSISCSKEYKISTILLSLIEFFKNKNIYYDSIEINLYYIKKEDGSFILDKDLEKEIKNESKFKWVRLENDGIKRKIKYHYVPNNLLENREHILYHNNLFEINKSAIYINNYVLIKYYENNANNNITMNENTKLYFILNILNKYLFLDNNDEKENILANFKGIKLKKIIRILSEYNNVLETNLKDFKSDYCLDDNCDAELLNLFLEIIEKKTKNSDDNNPLCLNFCKFFTNFDNVIKVEIDDYEYNIISMNDYTIEAFDTKNVTGTFNIYDNNDLQNEDGVLYYIKSETENISFILYEIKNDKIFDEDDNYIKLLFHKVLKKILIIDSNEPVKSYKKICIPSFIYNLKNIEKEIRNEDDKLKLMEYEVLDCNHIFQFCIEDLPFNDIKFSFPMNKNINNNELKIIKNSFVVAVLNPDLVLDYHLPALNIYYISKKNWIKVEK